MLIKTIIVSFYQEGLKSIINLIDGKLSVQIKSHLACLSKHLHEKKNTGMKECTNLQSVLNSSAFAHRYLY